jgi:hypothetical protein
LHKTGTTSIQWALTHSRPLLERNGILFPLAGVPKNAPYGQHLLAWSLIKRPDYVPVLEEQRASLNAQDADRLWDSLKAEIARGAPAKTILSSEEFDVLDAEEIAELGARLTDFDVYPILFLRNYADFLESSYRTAVVYSGCKVTADEYAAEQRTRLDFAQLVKDWSTIAAQGRINVLNYDDPSVRRDSLVNFLKCVDLDLGTIFPHARQNQNESVSAYVCELARFLRLEGVDEQSIGRWIERVSELPARPAGAARYSNMSPDLRASLDSRYAEELQILRATPPALAGHLVGAWGSLPSREVTHIRHVADALLALGWRIAD